MLVKIQLTTSEGETPPEMYKVSITALDASGHPTGTEEILEIGSAAGTGKDSMQVMLPSAGEGAMLVKESFPEPVYDRDQKATVPGEWPEPEAPPEGGAKSPKGPVGVSAPPPPKGPHPEGAKK